MTNGGTLCPEDYEEPQCLLCGMPKAGEPVQAIPQQRIREKLDEYMSRRDYAGVERHLRYWLEEAKANRDLRGELMVVNEMVGHYRKMGDRENALRCGDAALKLLEALEFEDNLSAATTFVNVATARNAFGENETALPLFRKARAIYEASPHTSPDLLGGLYNNMALTCTALGRYEDAMALYDLAMEKMAAVPGGALEQAVTCLNRADTLTARDGAEQTEQSVRELLDQAWDLLRDPTVPRDGYYAFVCEKCAPAFGYYGYFLAADTLSREAKEIYERT